MALVHGQWFRNPMLGARWGGGRTILRSVLGRFLGSLNGGSQMGALRSLSSKEGYWGRSKRGHGK